MPEDRIVSTAQKDPAVGCTGFAFVGLSPGKGHSVDVTGGGDGTIDQFASELLRDGKERVVQCSRDDAADRPEDMGRVEWEGDEGANEEGRSNEELESLRPLV